jgi:hypothetical protein
MKFRNLINQKLIMAFATLILVSCNYIFVGKNNKSDERLTRIQTNKLEAKLLVEVSKNNLSILQICENIQNVETTTDYKFLIEGLEKTHIELSKNYNALANEKLISIPSEVKKIHQINETNYDDFLKENLNEILNKIDYQIELLETLSKTTNNIEFKLLAIKDGLKLKTSTSRIENVLSELNKST